MGFLKSKKKKKDNSEAQSTQSDPPKTKPQTTGKTKLKRFGKATVFVILRAAATVLLLLTVILIALGPGMSCRASRTKQIGYTEYCDRSLMIDKWGEPFNITFPRYTIHGVKMIQYKIVHDLEISAGQMTCLIFVGICFLISCVLLIVHIPLRGYYGRLWHVLAVVNGTTAVLMAIVGALEAYYASCAHFRLDLEDSILKKMHAGVRTARFQCIVSGWAAASAFSLISFLVYAALALLNLAWMRENLLEQLQDDKSDKPVEPKAPKEKKPPPPPPVSAQPSKISIDSTQVDAAPIPLDPPPTPTKSTTPTSSATPNPSDAHLPPEEKSDEPFFYPPDSGPQAPPGV